MVANVVAGYLYVAILGLVVLVLPALTRGFGSALRESLLSEGLALVSDF